ncbi:MAG: hypothetical protein DYG90_05645 [Chloroflexi bacterium CFX6]|nr:hypothetical protein [Chloroflexi bacterium CFX6]
MNAAMSLTSLALANGQLVDAETGAVIPADDPTAVPADIVTALDTYARARVEADALAMRLDDIRQPHLAAYDAALAADSEYQATLARLAEARRVIDEMHEALDVMLPGRTDKVSLDTGRVLVTWGKPRSTWTLARPASWYASSVAREDFRRRVGGEDCCNPMPESQFAALMDAVFSWLAPGAKAGEAPAVRVTVRSGGGA